MLLLNRRRRLESTKMTTTVSGIGVEAVQVSQETETVRTQFTQEKTPASLAVIATLADVLNVDPVELPPLHDTVDTDALDALVRVRTGMDGDTHVTFTHAGHTITVHSYGMVAITLEQARTAADHEMHAGR